MKCIADLEHVESKEDAPWTSYYQWVTFVQLFQVGLSLYVKGTTKITSPGCMIHGAFSCLQMVQRVKIFMSDSHILGMVFKWCPVTVS